MNRNTHEILVLLAPLTVAAVDHTLKDIAPLYYRAGTAVLVVITAWLAFRNLKTNPKSILRRFPFLKGAYVPYLLGVVMFAGVAAAGFTLEGIVFPRVNHTFVVKNRDGKVMQDVLVLLADAGSLAKICNGQRTNATGAAYFEGISPGKKRLYLLHEDSPKGLEWMEFSLRITATPDSMTSIEFNPQVGCVVPAHPVEFEFRSSEVSASEFLSLEKQREPLARHRGRLLMIGNTDDIDTDEVNYVLGQKRCASVVSSISQFHCSPASIRAFSLGKTWPKRKEGILTLDQQRQANRRVEIFLITSLGRSR